MQNNLENLQQWLLYTAIGRHILREERNLLFPLVSNIFGNYSLQIGLPQINFLKGNKIANHYVVMHDIQCQLEQLPFATNSIDLIMCPHVLEYSTHYSSILNECYRILAPNGKLIITSFNTKSLFQIFKKTISALNSAKFLNLESLKLQLNSLNFSVESGNFYSYMPPFKHNRTLLKLSYLEKIGNRWFPTLSNGFLLCASKEVVPLTPVGKIKQRVLPNQQLVLSPG